MKMIASNNCHSETGAQVSRGFTAKFRPLLASVLFLGLFALPPAALAQTINKYVSNTGQATDSAADSLHDYAQQFTTGSHTAGYNLTRVDIDFSLAGISRPTYTVDIRDSVNGKPLSTSSFTLSNPDSLTEGLNSFYATQAIILNPNTSYFIVVDIVSGVTNSVSLQRTTSDDEDTGSATGWSIANKSYRRSWNTTDDWADDDQDAAGAARKIAVHGYDLTTTPSDPVVSITPSGTNVEIIDVPGGGTNINVPTESDLTLAAKAYDPDGGDIASYSWTVHEVNIETGAEGNDVTSTVLSNNTSATATFNSDSWGWFNVSLTVTDDDGATTTISPKLRVRARSEESGNGTISTLVMTNENGDELSLIAVDDDGNELTPRSGFSPMHFKYTAELNGQDLKVTATLGSDLAQFSIYSLHKMTSDTFHDATNPTSGEEQTFSDLDFDNNSLAISLRSGDRTQLFDYNITVTRPAKDPVAAITPRGPLNSVTNQAVNIFGLAYDPDGGDVTTVWSAEDGDGNAIDLDDLYVDYPEPLQGYVFSATAGTFALKLTVTDDEDNTTSTKLTMNVTTNQDPTAIIAPAGPVDVQIGTTLELMSLSTDPDGNDTIRQYAWFVYDSAGTDVASERIQGRTDEANAIFAAPATVGTYRVDLTITDTGSATDTVSLTVNVIDNQDPVVSITPSGAAASVDAGKNLTLTGSATDADTSDTIASYAWTVSDGTNPVTNALSSTNTAVTTFNTSTVGSYTATLTATDNRGGVGSAEVRVTVTDALVISPSSTISVSENEGTDSWTVALNSQPTGSVTVDIASSDESIATVMPLSLTFDSTDWDQPQTVTAIGQDDLIDNVPDRVATITHTVSGPDYTNATAPVTSVMVTAEDDDDPGIKLSASKVSIDEDAGTGTWTVALNTQPIGGAVTVSISIPSSGNTTVTDVAPSSLSFDATNWDQPQPVTATVVRDYIDSADRMVVITHSATGADYAGETSTVTVTAVNVDMAGVTIDPPPPTELTILEGGEDSYTVVLDSKPTGTVVVGIDVGTTDVPREITSEPTSLNFSTSNWNVPQTVKLSVEEATEADEDTTLTVTHTVMGGGYVDIDVASVTVNIPGFVVLDGDEVSYMVPADGMVMIPVDEGAPEAIEGIQLEFEPGDMPTITISEADPTEDKPSGFMAGDYVVEITSDTKPTGPVTICLPRQEAGGRVYRRDEVLEQWVALPLPHGDIPEGYACGVTNEFSLFATGEAPSGSVEKARLAQLGRVMAGQVVDAVKDRLAASREAGFKATMAGQALPSFDESADISAYASTPRYEPRSATTTKRDWQNTQVRALTEKSLLSGSSFSLTENSQGMGSVSVWGNASITGFESNGLQDGQMTSGFFGADWVSDDLTAGVALSLSRGKGTWTSDNVDEEFESTLTGIHPYFGYELSNRTSLWGVIGYGQGEVDMTKGNGRTTSADMDMLILAGGSSGDLGSTGLVGEDGSLSLNSDIQWVSMGSEEEKAEVFQLRVAAEASWLKATAGGGNLKPSAELGFRVDSGDAETGLGVDIGLGIEWRSPASGMSTRLQGRGLLTHAEDGLSEQGVSGSFGWDPNPGSAEGMNLTVSYTVGDSATGGTQALFSRKTLSAVESIGDDLDNHRMEIRLGYGVPVWGNRFIGTPQTAFGYSDDSRDVSLGWRMTLVDRSSVHGTGSLGLSVEARRNERASDGYKPEDEIVFRLRTQF